MKNLFSKTLLCGVLATSFLLINCQKAPSRKAPLDVNNPIVKPSVKVGVCTEAIAADYDLLQKSEQKIVDKLKTATNAASDVEELNGLAKELNGLAKKVMGAITLLKLDACKVHEANDEKKPVKSTANAINIKQRRSELGKTIKAKTKVDNEITLEDATAAAETLTVGQELMVGAELAAIMSDDANSKGAVAIANSKIEKGAAATALLADKAVTACALTISKKEDVNAGAAIKIVDLAAVKLDDQTKRKVMNVSVTVVVGTEGNSAMGFACNIADTKEGEAAKEIRKALGTLVSEVVRAQPVAPPVIASGDASGASGDSSSASGDSSSASGDSSVASGDATAAN